MGNFIKENKALAMFLFASLLLLVVIVAILTTSFLNLTELKRVEQSLVTEIEQRGGKMSSVKDKSAEKSVATSIEQTGYPSHLLASDTQLVIDFFKQAFTWSGDVAYEEARSHYIELLGEHNSFVETILEKDGIAMVEMHTSRLTEDGEGDGSSESDVQQPIEEANVEKAKAQRFVTKTDATITSEMDGVEIVPLRANRDVVHYIAFITYYVGDKILLESKTQLNPETAIIEISIADTEGGREIYNVEVWNMTE